MGDADKAQEQLILVDENDRELGVVPRGPAHRGKGIRHRAFQVLVFNRQGEILLARRQNHKLFGGLWDGGVSSHPLVDEDYVTAIAREVEEEIGVSGAPVERIGEIIYQASDGQGGAENEYCPIFKLVTDDKIVPDANEVAEIRWLTLSELKKDMQANPTAYTPWFKLASEKFPL